MQPIQNTQLKQPPSSQTIAADILSHPDRRIRLPEVKALTGYCTSSIYAKMRAGTFPSAQKLGGRAVAWRLGDILDFVNSRPSTIDQPEVTT